VGFLLPLRAQFVKRRIRSRGDQIGEDHQPFFGQLRACATTVRQRREVTALTLLAL